MKDAKSITRIIVISLLVSMILIFCVSFVHLNHDCTHDDNCLICALIHKFKGNLNGFIVKIVVVVLLIISQIVTYSSDRIKDKKKDTLVGLKVELLN